VVAGLSLLLKEMSLTTNNTPWEPGCLNFWRIQTLIPVLLSILSKLHPSYNFYGCITLIQQVAKQVSKCVMFELVKYVYLWSHVRNIVYFATMVNMAADVDGFMHVFSLLCSPFL